MRKRTDFSTRADIETVLHLHATAAQTAPYQALGCHASENFVYICHTITFYRFKTSSSLNRLRSNSCQFCQSGMWPQNMIRCYVWTRQATRLLITYTNVRCLPLFTSAGINVERSTLDAMPLMILLQILVAGQALKYHMSDNIIFPASAELIKPISLPSWSETWPLRTSTYACACQPILAVCYRCTKVAALYMYPCV